MSEPMSDNDLYLSVIAWLVTGFLALIFLCIVAYHLAPDVSTSDCHAMCGDRGVRRFVERAKNGAVVQPAQCECFETKP